MAKPVQGELYPVPSEKTALGWLSHAGEINNSPGLGGTMRVFGQRALVLLTGGEGFYADANGFSRRVSQGSVVHVFAALPHRYGPFPGGRWDEIFLCFGGPIFDLFETQGLLNPLQPVWDMPAAKPWERRMRAVMRGWKWRNDALPAVVQWAEFLAEASAVAFADAAAEPWLKKILGLLDHEMRLPLSRPAEQMAAACGMGYESLRKKFRGVMGCGVVEYHRRRILDRATDMLRQTRWTLSEIAEVLGFCDEFHLAKAYKAEFGITPGDARRRSERGKEGSTEGPNDERLRAQSPAALICPRVS